jgi:hypothetical protein
MPVHEHDQTNRPISLTLRDAASVTLTGWIEENPNGSITFHDSQGKKTIYMKDEFREWHFADSETPTAGAGR